MAGCSHVELWGGGRTVGGAGGVLQWVTHGVTNHGGSVCIASLATQVAGCLGVASLDVLLCTYQTVEPSAGERPEKSGGRGNGTDGREFHEMRKQRGTGASEHASADQFLHEGEAWISLGLRGYGQSSL